MHRYVSQVPIYKNGQQFEEMNRFSYACIALSPNYQCLLFMYQCLSKNNKSSILNCFNLHGHI